MSMDHPPSVFVSSTITDLDPVRKELESFIGDLGMIPVLSNSPSFPVDPNLNAIENCLKLIKEKTDIFVLVVGARYGSEAENGKSVTNLEYLWAKDKGIPLYVFIQKDIQAAYWEWKKDPSDDVLKIVDSSKLFEFVDLLYNPTGKNWVYSFDSAQDIIKTLRDRLAYLFMDALTIHTKVRQSGLPESLWQDLSGTALRLVVEKPPNWEYRLFSQVLSDEISRVASIKKDFKYGLALGKAVRLGELTEIIDWAHKKIGELQSFVNSAGVLFDKALPKALGAPGETSDVEEIVYVARRLADVYQRVLEWAMEFRLIQVEDNFSRLLELIAVISHNVIDEFEAFPAYINQRLDDAEKRYNETKEPQSILITLILTCPEMTEFEDELKRLQKELS